MTMTIRNKKTTMFTTTIAVILTVTIALTLTQSTFGQTSDVTLVKLEQAHDIVAQQMIQQNFTAIIEDKLVDESIAKIPFTISYVDTLTNKLVIGIDSDAPLPKVVYEKKIRNIVGDIPIDIFYGKVTRDSCTTNQQSVCMPRIGGIKVTSTTGPTPVGTSTYVTSRSPGPVIGFVMSSHVAGSGTGQTVGQPLTSNPIGTVTTNPSLSNRASDSAFVTLNGGVSYTLNAIYKTSTTNFSIIGKAPSSSTPVNSFVRMDGAYSGTQTGQITAKGVTVSDTTGTLTNQVTVTYTSQAGDSGGPVFSPTETTNVTLYGIHVGKFCTVTTVPCPAINLRTFYSPWEGIQSDLGVN